MPYLALPLHCHVLLSFTFTLHNTQCHILLTSPLICIDRTPRRLPVPRIGEVLPAKGGGTDLLRFPGIPWQENAFLWVSMGQNMLVEHGKKFGHSMGKNIISNIIIFRII